MDTNVVHPSASAPLSRVYVRGDGWGYTDAESRIGEHVDLGDGCFVTKFKMERFVSRAVRVIRVDPADHPGICRIEEIEISDDRATTLVRWNGERVGSIARNLNAVRLSSPGASRFELWSLHDDPHFEIDISDMEHLLSGHGWTISIRWSFESVPYDEGLEVANRLIDATRDSLRLAPPPQDARVRFVEVEALEALLRPMRDETAQVADEIERDRSRFERRSRRSRAVMLARSREQQERWRQANTHIEALSAQVTNLAAALAQQSTRAARTDAELAAMRETVATLAMRLRPWRLRDALGAVARRGSRFWRSYFDYLRAFVFTPVPRTDVVADGDGWHADGLDPSFVLEARSFRLMTAGWYLFDCDAAMIGDARLVEPCLYVDYGAGQSESTRICLKFLEVDGGLRALVKLAGDVRALRFDPSTSPCRFTLERVRMRKLTSPEAAARLAGPVMRGKWLDPRALWGASMQLLRVLATQGAGGVQSRLVEIYETETGKPHTYLKWVAEHDTLTDGDREAIRARIAQLAYRPVISIVMPTYQTPERWLRRCLDTVLAQLYPHWELCIADDASPSPHVAAVLAEYAARDPRVRYVVREKNGHISASSNSALALARGDYVALLDHDDELAEHALYHVAEALNESPRPRIVYSDEDKIDEAGARFDPYFKTDWNPDLFRGHNMISHLGVYEKRLLDEVGGFRLGYEGSQDYDLALRCIERLRRDEIRHIPRVLYHWRAIAGSTALGPGEKNYAHVAAHKSLTEHLARIGLDGEILAIERHAGNWRMQHHLAGEPRVTIIVPTRNRLDHLSRCIESVRSRSTYRNVDIIVVDNQSDEAPTLAWLDELRKTPRCAVIRVDEPFNFSRLNNIAARQAQGEVLLFLNNDVEVITPEWIEELVAPSLRPGVGAVGAMLYYPDDRIQHAGIVLGIGAERVAGHAYHFKPRGYPGDKCRARLVQEMSAVTAACMAIRRDRFDEVGGFDESLPVAFNDVDLCLRLMRAGYRNLWTPNAELYHFESATRGSDTRPERRAQFLAECEKMRVRWGELLLRDPYYHPSFSLDSNDFLTYAWPRSTAPWRSDGPVHESNLAAQERTEPGSSGS